MTVSGAPPRLLKTDEVAALLRISPSRVKVFVHAGVLHPIRLIPGGHFRYHTAEIESLIGAPPSERSATS